MLGLKLIHVSEGAPAVAVVVEMAVKMTAFNSSSDGEAVILVTLPLVIQKHKTMANSVHQHWSYQSLALSHP